MILINQYIYAIITTIQLFFLTFLHLQLIPTDTPSPRHPMICFLRESIYLFYIFQVNEIIHYVTFCVQFPHLVNIIEVHQFCSMYHHFVPFHFFLFIFFFHLCKFIRSKCSFVTCVDCIVVKSVFHSIHHPNHMHCTH